MFTLCPNVRSDRERSRRNNQWEWEGNGNKMRFSLGSGMGMRINQWECEEMGLIKSFALISNIQWVFRIFCSEVAIACPFCLTWYGIPSCTHRPVFCIEGPNERERKTCCSLTWQIELNAFLKSTKLSGCWCLRALCISIVGLSSPSLSESRLLVYNVHFWLHSDPFQYDPIKDVACMWVL